MWGSYCNIPKAIFYLLKGDYRYNSGVLSGKNPQEVPLGMQNVTLRVQVPNNHMVVSLNYCSQNGGNVYRAPYYNGNPNIGPRIIGNLDQSPYTSPKPVLKLLLPNSQVPKYWVLGSLGQGACSAALGPGLTESFFGYVIL